MKHSISECIPCWSLLAEKHRRRLQDNAIFRSYKRREHVVFKTVKKDGIVFVLEGGIRVYLASDTGREVTLFHLKKGDAFSIMTVDNALETDVIPCLQSDGETTLAYLQRPDMAVVAHDEWQMALFIYETCAKSAQAILNNISYFVFNDLRHTMGFFDKMFSGLTKTRKNIEELEEVFRNYDIDSEDFYDELEEMLIMADVGGETTAQIMMDYKRILLRRYINKGKAAKEAFVGYMQDMLGNMDTKLKLDTKPSVILMVGVNGVGKTTTIGKLSASLKAEGKNVLLCAGDTFRAAAAEQLGVWAERSGADIVRHEEGSDPAAVVYDGLCAAKARGTDVVIIDTAGRLHNKANLMNELNKITRVVRRELPDADVDTLMVLDATTGQNGLIQAKQFLETAGITGIVLTKLDGTAKGGIVFAISNELKLPVKYVGVGEGIDDLIPFNPHEFVEALFK